MSKLDKLEARVDAAKKRHDHDVQEASYQMSYEPAHTGYDYGYSHSYSHSHSHSHSQPHSHGHVITSSSGVNSYAPDNRVIEDWFQPSKTDAIVRSARTSSGSRYSSRRSSRSHRSSSSSMSMPSFDFEVPVPAGMPKKDDSCGFAFDSLFSDIEVPCVGEVAAATEASKHATSSTSPYSSSYKSGSSRRNERDDFFDDGFMDGFGGMGGISGFGGFQRGSSSIRSSPYQRSSSHRSSPYSTSSGFGSSGSFSFW